MKVFLPASQRPYYNHNRKQQRIDKSYVNRGDYLVWGGVETRSGKKYGKDADSTTQDTQNTQNTRRRGTKKKTVPSPVSKAVQKVVANLPPAAAAAVAAAAAALGADPPPAAPQAAVVPNFPPPPAAAAAAPPPPPPAAPPFVPLVPGPGDANLNLLWNARGELEEAVDAVEKARRLAEISLDLKPKTTQDIVMLTERKAHLNDRLAYAREKRRELERSMNDSPLLKRAYMLWTLAYGQYNRTDSKIEAALKEWRSGLKTREKKEEIARLEREAAEKEKKKKTGFCLKQ